MQPRAEAASETGASATEYALLIAGIATVLVIAIYALGGVTLAMFDETCEELDKKVAATCAS